ncbi:hypothetical protein F4141_02955 [Candidatus Poribacteria bacterium]|nr:hypothetical protein [Candidatus Poribacteria bacterium]
MMRDLHAKNPELMKAKVKSIENVSFTILFGEDSAVSDIWEKFHNQVENRMLKRIIYEIEEFLNASVRNDDLKKHLWIEREAENNQLQGIVHGPKQVIDELRQAYDDFRVQTVINTWDRFRQVTIDNARNIGQVNLPDIHITLIFPTSNTLNILRYRTEGEVTKEEYIYSLPSVTLDTDVLLKMKKRESVDMQEFRKTYLVDLAVSQRIREDIKFRPDEEKFLSDYYIRTIPSIMRCNFDSKAQRFLVNPEFNKLGCTEFLKSAESIINNFFKPKGETPPGYLDWDHLHAHYLSGRDIFLTDDKKILKVKDQLKEKLGIVVMNLENFVNTFKSNDDLTKSFGKANSIDGVSARI